MGDLAHALCGFSESEWLALSLTARIRLTASLYLGWGYSLRDPQFAHWHPALPQSRVRPPFTASVTNCSSHTASQLIACYPRNPWTETEYAELQVFRELLEAGRDDSPMDAIERVGVGNRTGGFIDYSWHLVQGWRSFDPPSGHAFLVYSGPHGLIMLEATSRGYVGPRWQVTTEAALRLRYTKALHIGVLASGIAA